MPDDSDWPCVAFEMEIGSHAKDTPPKRCSSHNEEQFFDYCVSNYQPTAEGIASDETVCMNYAHQPGMCCGRGVITLFSGEEG